MPYRGMGPAIIDLIGGQIPSVMSTYPPLVAHAKAGGIRLLGYVGASRPKTMPDVPTFKEIGPPALQAPAWFLLAAPKGTPQAVVKRYNEIIVKAQRQPDIIERIRVLELGIEEDMTPEKVAALLQADHDRWAQVVKTTGFTAASQ